MCDQIIVDEKLKHCVTSPDFSRRLAIEILFDSFLVTVCHFFMGRNIICFLALIGKTTLRETLFINDLARLCYHDFFFYSKFCVTFSISFPVNVIFLRFICKYRKTTPFKHFIPRAKKTKRKNLG